MSSRLACDVDDEEDAEIRRQNGMPPWHATPANNYRTPATGAATGGRQGGGSSSGEGEAQGPPPFPHEQVAGAAAGASAAAAAGAQAGAGDGVDGEEEDQPPPPGEVAPRPTTFPENRRGQIEDQAANIKTQFEGRRGMSTYKTTWKEYESYHMHRYGEPAPHCPYTGLLWLSIAQGVHFISYMARCKKSSSQASPPPFVLAYSCYLQAATLLSSGWMGATTSPPHLTSVSLCSAFPGFCQISSARSALNYLLNAWHSISRIGDPENTPLWHARLTTKDAVSSSAATLLPSTVLLCYLPLFVAFHIMQVVENAMNVGIQVAKRKKAQTVGLQKGLPSSKRKAPRDAQQENGEGEGEEEEPAERELQKDPLKGKIREALPDEYLTRVMRW